MKRTLIAEVPPEAFLHLRQLLGTRHTLSLVERGSLREALRTTRATVVVIDPVWALLDIPIVADMLRRRSPVQVIAYLSATSEAVSAILPLAAAGLRHALLADATGNAQAIEQALAFVESDPLVAGIVDEIVALMLDEPRFAAVIRELFRRPHRFDSASDIARAADMSVTYVRRHLVRAGIPSPRRLFVVARVSNAHALLREPMLPVKVVAMRLGYNHPRVLNRHFQAIFGLGVGRARRVLTDEIALRDLRDWLLHGDAVPAAT